MDRRAAGEMQKRFYFFTKYKTLLYAGTKRRYIDEQRSASFIMTLDSIRDFLGVKILRIISGQRVSRYISDKYKYIPIIRIIAYFHSHFRVSLRILFSPPLLPRDIPGKYKSVISSRAFKLQ